MADTKYSAPPSLPTPIPIPVPMVSAASGLQPSQIVFPLERRSAPMRPETLHNIVATQLDPGASGIPPFPINLRGRAPVSYPRGREFPGLVTPLAPPRMPKVRREKAAPGYRWSRGVQVPLSQKPSAVAARNRHAAQRAVLVNAGLVQPRVRNPVISVLHEQAKTLRPEPSTLQQANTDKLHDVIAKAKSTYVKGSGAAAWQQALANARNQLGVVAKPKTLEQKQKALIRKNVEKNNPQAALAKQLVTMNRAATRANRILDKDLYGPGLGPRLSGIRTQIAALAQQVGRF